VQGDGDRGSTVDGDLEPVLMNDDLVDDLTEEKPTLALVSRLPDGVDVEVPQDRSDLLELVGQLVSLPGGTSSFLDAFLQGADLKAEPLLLVVECVGADLVVVGGAKP
jgi:hypothetical protein